MKDKIEEIVGKVESGHLEPKEAIDELLLLHNVSQRSELLVAYEKQHYTPSEWLLASKQCEKEIDDFLATNCG